MLHTLLRRPACLLLLCCGAPSVLVASDVSPCAEYDFDSSRLVDRKDLERFQACLTGPDLGPPAPGCEGMDFDLDSDVDQSDFGMLQPCMGTVVLPVWPVISEFMASNGSTHQAADGRNYDWIELHNPGTEDIPLEGWHLTDNPGNLDKWRFPPVTLKAGKFLIVFASEAGDAAPAGELHANFKLDGQIGEYVGLVTPDLRVVSEYHFSPQVGDVSYGLAMSGREVGLLAAGAECRVKVPSDGSQGLRWTEQLYPEEGGWSRGTTGVGFDRSTSSVDYNPLIGANINSAMYRVNNSAYIRIPFRVDDPAELDSLSLKMKYDDGFAAFINGRPVGARNSPDFDELTWQSKAPQSRSDTDALVYEELDLSESLDALRPGVNVLAIQALNYQLIFFLWDNDLLVLPELSARIPGSLLEPRIERYFVLPTPGKANVGGAERIGPRITEPQHTPLVPTDNENLIVTVRVTPTLQPIATVRMTYRAMYRPEVTVNMFDTGTHGDGTAGDGVYGAMIPASASAPGEMVRYFFTATDAQGAATRWPLYPDPTNTAQYFGTMIENPAVSTPLPVLHWFVQDTAAADTPNKGARCSLFYDGEFYDNVYCRPRGNTSLNWQKHNYKFDFNPSGHFRFDPLEDRVEEFNLNSTYSDKAYVRQVLGAETYRDAGCPYGISFPMRVQRNNQFFSVATFVEQPDTRYLRRNGLDDEGALYKMGSQLDTAGSGWEKKTRRNESNADLQALVSGLALTGEARRRFVYDNVDIPACINYIAATTIMHDNDHVAKNYYLYRDSEGDGEWQFLPWDKDLTFGRNFNGGGVLNDTMWADDDNVGRASVSPSHPLFGDSDHQKYDYLWNRLIDALHDTPEIRAMYLRRLRTLMDDLLQPPGTPVASLKYETRIDELVAAMAVDAATDYTAWSGIDWYGQRQDLPTAIAILKNEYFTVRRTHLFNTHSVPGNGIIPGPQPAAFPIRFGAVEYQPASGAQDEEYIELLNPNAFAADVSGWALDGAARVTLNPGTVIPAGGRLYVVPKVWAFRARTVSPKGGEGRLVQGNYEGHLISGETVRLLRPDGSEAAVYAVP